MLERVRRHRGRRLDADDPRDREMRFAPPAQECPERHAIRPRDQIVQRNVQCRLRRRRLLDPAIEHMDCRFAVSRIVPDQRGGEVVVQQRRGARERFASHVWIRRRFAPSNESTGCRHPHENRRDVRLRCIRDDERLSQWQPRRDDLDPFDAEIAIHCLTRSRW